MFDDLFLEANLVFNLDDIYYKFNEWRKAKGKNILLVTGLSGSGKSTLTDKLHSKYNANAVFLDSFDQMKMDEDPSGFMKKFFDKKNIDTDAYERVWDIPNLSYWKIINEFFQFCISEAKKNPNTLYVIEGLQLFAYVGKPQIEDFPMIIKGTSYLVSQYRRLQRDGSSKNIIGNLLDELKSVGLATFKINLQDQKTLKELRTSIENKGGNGGMFNDLLREATMPDEYYLPDNRGKIKAFEDAFGDDEMKKSIAYGFSSSHEYDEPSKKKAAVKSSIRFVNNYNWVKKDMKVNKIEAFNKPLNMKKVYNICKTIEEKGNTEPLIVVNKIYGFNWQSKGKEILTDGNHRLGALKVLEKDTSPVYHGIYTGNAERDAEEFIPSSLNESDQNASDSNFITEAVFEHVPNTKNFFMEDAIEFQILQESIKKRRIERVELTPEEKRDVEAKYGGHSSLFFKDSNSGKYYCGSRVTSKPYDSPTDIPMSVVKLVERAS